MELRDYLRIIRRCWILILGTTVAVMAVAALVTLRATPQYASNSRLFISTSASSSAGTSGNDTYTNGLAATQRVTSYASLVTDGELTRRVVDALELDISPAQLADKIQAQVVPDTVLLKLQVTDADPKMAQHIDKEVVNQLQMLISEIETPPGKSKPQLKATLVGPATLPTSPVSPNPVRNLLLGTILGLLLGLAIAVVRELLDTSVRSVEDVDNVVDAPVLGGIAFDADTPKHPLVTTLGSHAPRAEAFRVLRTNLQFVNIDAGGKIYVVTSSVPGEGKSTTACNVAITMSQAGQRVLLMDGDLRRPQVADMLGLENVVGVTTVLLGKVGIADATQEHHVSGLKVLASGAVPPNPADLLQSRAMGDLLATLRQQFDTIIIDSPPLLPVTDAALLASQIDGAVVVVRHGKTTREQLAGSAQRLAAVDARLLGVVFNQVPAKGGSYGYGYGYGYAPDKNLQTDRPVSALETSAPAATPVTPATASPVAGGRRVRARSESPAPLRELAAVDVPRAEGPAAPAPKLQDESEVGLR